MLYTACIVSECFVHLQDDRLSFFDFSDMPDNDRHTVESILYTKGHCVKAVEVFVTAHLYINILVNYSYL